MGSMVSMTCLALARTAGWALNHGIQRAMAWSRHPGRDMQSRSTWATRGGTIIQRINPHRKEKARMASRAANPRRMCLANLEARGSMR